MRIEDPPEPLRTQILLGLLKHPKIHGVWCEGSVPRIRYENYGEPITIGWEEAAKLTGVLLPERKPVGMEHDWRVLLKRRRKA